MERQVKGRKDGGKTNGKMEGMKDGWKGNRKGGKAKINKSGRTEERKGRQTEDTSIRMEGW
jgi:hypothetical protein